MLTFASNYLRSQNTPPKLQRRLPMYIVFCGGLYDEMAVAVLILRLGPLVWSINGGIDRPVRRLT